MEKVELPVHEHPLIPFTGFTLRLCRGCGSRDDYIYGGYRCNKLGCESLFHRECAESLPEINHSSHPDHPLKLMTPSLELSTCSLCRVKFSVGYFCSTCDFKLDLDCARRPHTTVILEKYNVHQHELTLCYGLDFCHPMQFRNCRVCDTVLFREKRYYRCYQCNLGFHPECVEFYPEAYHTSHPKHPLKLLTCDTDETLQPKDPLKLLKYEAPDYADKKCLLCGRLFHGRLHHCDVSNFSICTRCMSNPPPLGVLSLRTHEHQLYLVPRCIDFTCNACGTLGDRSPYFCLQCNFMIHWECIDLPRVININRHDHRISYTSRLGHGKWKCGVCRKKVDGFYGAYSCSKCSNYVVHSRCATRNDVWDMIELEGTLEPEEVAPFEVIDDNTIKHFSHDHNLRINKDVDGGSLHENTLCRACVFQICSEPFYSCEQCDFILHPKCANLPKKKRHVSHNQPFTLDVNSESEVYMCDLCLQKSNGFRYVCQSYNIDVQCGSISEPFEHDSHPHPLYHSEGINKYCNSCHQWTVRGSLSCDECDYSLDFECALTPEKVMRHRYDDHPLFLSYGESSTVEGDYWCEACETKVNPKNWFYTCNDCGVILHISCVLGELTYIKPGTILSRWNNEVVVPNTSVCRNLCTGCKSRCKLPSNLQTSTRPGVVKCKCASYCFPRTSSD